MSDYCANLEAYRKSRGYILMGFGSLSEFEIAVRPGSGDVEVDLIQLQDDGVCGG